MISISSSAGLRIGNKVFSSRVLISLGQGISNCKFSRDESQGQGKEGGMMKGLKSTGKVLFLFLGLSLLILQGSSGIAIGEARLLKATIARCAAPNNAVVSYFGVIGSAPPALAEAIRQFPKGADIHNHLTGTVMPEDYIAMGIADGDCFGADHKDPTMYTINPNTGTPDSCASGDKPLSQASSADRQKLVSSLSMYNYTYSDIQSGEDQFFATFGRFGTVSGSSANIGIMMAKLLQQANKDTVSYVETMMSFQSTAVSKLADLLRQKYPDAYYYTKSEYYGQMYSFLLRVGLKDAVVAAQQDVAGYMSKVKAILKCGTPSQDPACLVSYTLLSQVNRNAAITGTPDLPKIFTQTAFSFLLSNTEKNVVGLNLVSGEDSPVSMQTFPTVMQFFSFFNSIFPNVNIALHAGEITPCFVGVGNPALKDHLTGSLKAGAKRIGHGISFAYLNSDDRAEVIGLMKSKNALVEVLFTSNAQILGVAGDDHPFSLYYWQYGVPTSFSTDDEGVSHATYTNEWVYAYQQYAQFTYDDMVRLARYSLQYSFAQGNPLWLDVTSAKIVSQCAGARPGSPNPPEPCKSFLANSGKATLQWNYEASLSSYEKNSGQRLRNYKGKTVN